MQRAKRPTFIGLEAERLGFDTAHLTVIYLGELDKDRINYADWVVQDLKDQYWDTHYVTRNKLMMFGPDHDIPVMTVTSNGNRLFKLRELLEDKYGLISASEFDFNPHITLQFNHCNDVRIPRIIKLTNLGLY